MQLDGKASTSDSTNIVSYVWTVADPSAQQVVATFDAGASDTHDIVAADVPIGGGVTQYDVTLTITDDTGASSSDITTLDVPAVCGNPNNQPPVAALSGGASLSLGCGKTVTIDGTSSSDPDGNDEIVSYTYTFKDAAGTVATTKVSTSGKAIVSQLSDGLLTNTNYTIELVVKDVWNAASDVATQILKVGNCPPLAIITPPASTAVACGGSLTWLGDASSDPDASDIITSWSWKFTYNGTSISKSGSSATISYTADKLVSGATYAVSLTVKDNRGSSSAAATSSMPVQAGCKVNTPPVCTAAVASIPRISSTFDHTLRNIYVTGVTDADGDAVTISVTKVTQDEGTKLSDTNLAGTWACPDAVNKGSYAQVAAEWLKATSGGNGRVYAISYTASDGKGGSCSGTVKVCVRSGTTACGDDGQKYTATTCV